MQISYQPVLRAACINGFLLKLIAIATMLIDHIGAVLYPDQMIFRYIGRIAFPVFVFLLVEGFYYTRNIRKYELRLLLFAIISECPFDLAFNDAVLEFQSQNVFFTLFLGLLMLDLMQKVKGQHWKNILILVIFTLAAVLLQTDYDAGGILLVYCFYKFRNQPIPKYIGLGAISLLLYEPIQYWSLLAAIPLTLYNGERGFRPDGRWYSGRAGGAGALLVKYLFYVFYPVHLLILYFISVNMVHTFIW
ncbi:MAG: conjugal transfer protein TraX [Lachnospiraceae bacterium]|nr:conjugal transfer protein TraX [Lachnospiraceae bacterium]